MDINQLTEYLKSKGITNKNVPKYISCRQTELLGMALLERQLARLYCKENADSIINEVLYYYLRNNVSASEFQEIEEAFFSDNEKAY